MQSIPVVKLGMWGGSRSHGKCDDLSVMPWRLLSVTIRCGDAIDSIMFSYIGTDLKEHVAGPWGGPYGDRTTYNGISFFLELLPSKKVSHFF